ncbi:hypothetical protein FQR65_LT12952 [Abscondita terminalis]|nr:hypothetical protein FQR65_LT12952 [Abscondita terminalis]
MEWVNDLTKDLEQKENKSNGMRYRSEYRFLKKRRWIFERIVKRVMKYGAEVWGWREWEKVEKIPGVKIGDLTSCTGSDANILVLLLLLALKEGRYDEIDSCLKIVILGLSIVCEHFHVLLGTFGYAYYSIKANTLGMYAVASFRNIFQHDMTLSAETDSLNLLHFRVNFVVLNTLSPNYSVAYSTFVHASDTQRTLILARPKTLDDALACALKPKIKLSKKYFVSTHHVEGHQDTGTVVCVRPEEVQ